MMYAALGYLGLRATYAATSHALGRHRSTTYSMQASRLSMETDPNAEKLSATA